ncbi:Hypothetical protein LUCI_1988 [Lucifera butyrica]|uniref:Uncharacterized protein n=1 Tax=Lucifera butyrica TaxID=1351585 RepID=A0A498R902_9FIRM|nr:hypothetical protein [Lucifera butyrica]VBB06752.1 Hypothetical protein LUCI_1988 [Lucifera butyrica]
MPNGSYYNYPYQSYANYSGYYAPAGYYGGLPSDYADLLQVALANHLSGFAFWHYRLSMDELQYHYQGLQRGIVTEPETCLHRCRSLYQQCLDSATTGEQRRQCGRLYRRCMTCTGTLPDQSEE